MENVDRNQMKRHHRVTVRSFIDALWDVEFQRHNWVEAQNLHAMEDAIEDFPWAIEGAGKACFAEYLAGAYEAFGVELAHAMFPLLVALDACNPTLPKDISQLQEYLDSPLWQTVLARADDAFRVIDRIVRSESPEIFDTP